MAAVPGRGGKSLDAWVLELHDYLARVGPDEEAMAPWRWRQLPAHARSRYVQSLPLDKAPRDEYGRLAAGPDWVHRKAQERLFNIRAITEGLFMGREGEELVSTWDPPKVMKRIQMLGAHEQVVSVIKKSAPLARRGGQGGVGMQYAVFCPTAGQ